MAAVSKENKQWEAKTNSSCIEPPNARERMHGHLQELLSIGDTVKCALYHATVDHSTHDKL